MSSSWYGSMYSIKVVFGGSGHNLVIWCHRHKVFFAIWYRQGPQIMLSGLRYLLLYVLLFKKKLMFKEPLRPFDSYVFCVFFPKS